MRIAQRKRLTRILAEDISPLQPYKVYELPTPYNTFGAGQALMAAMAKDTEKSKSFYA